MKKILFTGGGSAGHATPNVALIEDLKNSYEIYYIGTEGVEKNLITPLKIPYFSVDCPKFIRGFSFKNLKIPARLLSAEEKCKDILEKIKPDVVFSKGGYVSVPVVAAAHAQKIPCLTHESDLSLGLANKLNARRCIHVLTSFPETADEIKNGKYTGSPIRKELFKTDRTAAREKYGFHREKPVLLFFGGGSGSRTINEALRKNIDMLSRRYDILHICGKNNVMQNNIAGYIQREYENDMASAYACADMVVARAGSNTVFETLALKKKALFIPLENAASRGDQRENAEYFERKKLCSVLRERDLDRLFTAIERAFDNRAISDNLAVTNIADGNKNIIKEIAEAANR